MNVCVFIVEIVVVCVLGHYTNLNTQSVWWWRFTVSDCIKMLSWYDTSFLTNPKTGTWLWTWVHLTGTWDSRQRIMKSSRGKTENSWKHNTTQNQPWQRSNQKSLHQNQTQHHNLFHLLHEETEGWDDEWRQPVHKNKTTNLDHDREHAQKQDLHVHVNTSQPKPVTTE